MSVITLFKTKITNAPLGLFFFTFFILIEFYFFKSYILKNITYFYPTSFDQASYLPLTYSTYENVKQYGLISGFSISPPLATGFLFPIQATLFYLAFGASRFVSLLPNFIYFILLQIMSLVAIRSLTKKNYFSFIFLGLILAIDTPFAHSGGLMDFRIDFMAFCLYGIILGSAIKSKLFLNTKWSLITALFSVILMLLRCITIVYLPILFGMTVIYLYFITRPSSKNNIAYSDNKLRLRNLLLISICLGIVALFYIWLNRNVLFNYYMVGHFLGNEKNIRALEVGVTSFASLLLFYPTSLLIDHITPLGIEMGISFLALLTFVLLKTKSIVKSTTNDIPWKIGLMFLLCSLFVPLLILTLDVNKSPVVGSIMVMPLLWLIMGYGLYIDKKLMPTRNNSMILSYLGVLFLTIGLWHQLSNFLQHKSKNQYANLSAITKMYQDIGDYAVAQNWAEIRLSDDQICDYLTSGGMETVYYETRGKLLPINIERMGGAIFAIKKEEAISSLEKSNVVILNLNDYPGNSPYPFNQSIRELKPFLAHFAETHFTRLGDYQFMDSTFRVYVESKNKISIL